MKQVPVTHPVVFSFGGRLYFDGCLPLLLRFPTLDQVECFAAFLDPFPCRALSRLELDTTLHGTSRKERFFVKIRTKPACSSASISHTYITYIYRYIRIVAITLLYPSPADPGRPTVEFYPFGYYARWSGLYHEKRATPFFYSATTTFGSKPPDPRKRLFPLLLCLILLSPMHCCIAPLCAIDHIVHVFPHNSMLKFYFFAC